MCEFSSGLCAKLCICACMAVNEFFSSCECTFEMPSWQQNVHQRCLHSDYFRISKPKYHERFPSQSWYILLYNTYILNFDSLQGWAGVTRSQPGNVICLNSHIPLYKSSGCMGGILSSWLFSPQWKLVVAYLSALMTRDSRPAGHSSHTERSD